MIEIRRMLHNFFSVTVMRLLTSIISFAFFSVLARQWGAESLGEFSTVFSIFMFLWQIPLLGLHIVIARTTATNPETLKEQATNALILSITVSILLLIVIGYLGQALYPESMHTAIWLVGVSTIFMAITSVAEAVLIGQERMHIIAWANIAENIFRVCLGVVLVLAGYGLTEVVAVFVFSRIFSVIIYIKKGNLYELFDHLSISKISLKKYLVQCPTFFGILLLSCVIGRFDFIILSLIGSMHDVGMYSPSFKIYEISLMIPSMITVVLFPVFSRFYQSDQSQYDRLYVNAFKFTFALGAPFVIILAYLSIDFIELIFGSEYVAGGAALQLLAFAVMFVALDQILTAVTLSAKREDIELKILIITSSIYIILLFTLIPILGFMGAAIATLGASFIKLVVRYIWLINVFNIPGVLHQLLRPVFAVVILCAFLVFASNYNSYLVSGMGLLIYFLILFFVKGVYSSDLNTFKNSILNKGV